MTQALTLERRPPATLPHGEAGAAAIELAGLRHTYTSREALAGVDLRVQRGEVFGLLGPNGGGKTTLFRILSTLMLPSAGTARIGGVDAAADPHGARRRICVVFQSPSLDGRLGVRENLQHQGHLYGLGGAELTRRIDEVLERIGLTERAADRVETLSGGQQRRVEIGKALLHRPEVLLLDEPTTGLDPGVRLEIWEILQQLRREHGLTVLISTHLLDEAERCDRVAILHHGRIVALGAPTELRSRIGGDVLVLRGTQPEALRARLRERHGVEAQELDGALRVEHPHGAELLIELLQDGVGRLEAASLGKPTLEDVFVQHTGMTLSEGAALPGERAEPEAAMPRATESAAAAIAAAPNERSRTQRGGTRPGLVLPAATLWQREMVRFWRQPNRVVGAIAQPLIFWLLFGAGFGASFRLPGAAADGAAAVSYMEYFFPGSVALIVLFTAIFSTMSIIEDRREGFLQAVLVAPVSRSAIVLGKVLGGTSVAVLEACLFVLLAPLAGLPIGAGSALALIGVLFLVGFGLTALGFCIAWGLDSVQGFHAIMMVLLMPMWLLSGAFFPAEGVPRFLALVMTLNPMTYAVASLRHVLYLGGVDRSGAIPSLGLSLLLTLLFAAASFAGAFALASRRDQGRKGAARGKRR